MENEIVRHGKIGIITFHCVDDLGGMIQAYALLKFISRTSRDVEIINYSPYSMVGRYWFIPYYPNLTLKSMIVNVLINLRDFRMVLGRKRRMREFRNRFLSTSHGKIRTVSGISKRKYDYYVIGSDQVWNPQITMGLNPVYFGHFPKAPKSRVIAYAPSLGSNKIEDVYMQEMSNLLKSVDHISTREASAIPFLSRLTEKPIVPVLDPAFLLCAEEYESIMNVPDQEGYVLIYLTMPNENAAKFAEQLAKHYNRKVIALNRPMVGYEEFNYQYQCGPHDFIGWIHHAGFVITNSFHATVLSIIFKKKFYVFSHSTLSARTTDILHALGLDMRILIRSSEQDVCNANHPFEEEIAYANLECLKNKSEAYLLECLNLLQ